MDFNDPLDTSINTGNISTDEFLAIFTSTSALPREAGGGPGGGGGGGSVGSGGGGVVNNKVSELKIANVTQLNDTHLTSLANSTSLNPPLFTIDGQYTITNLLNNNSLTSNIGSTVSSSLPDINDTIFFLSSNFYNTSGSSNSSSNSNSNSSSIISSFASSAINLTSNYANFNNQSYTNLTGNLTEVHWDGRYPSGYTLTHIVVASIIVTILMIIIIVGNMLVIIAIATEKSLKNIQNWFIASLAVADFFLGLVIMPFSLANELMGYWIFGSWWCDIHSAMDVLLCTASIMNLCLISLDRYWSITKAVDYLKSRTPARAALMIAAVWIMSALICIPPLLGWKVKLPEGPLPKCQIIWIIV
uniref:G-protein coupled receptors family 1 profile domain-containing protein n=1 Tax=Glossina brevipalpis TaxID=37001 RepID=A0A1A9W6H1_9MUSC